jgi:hypothetical protein
VPRTSVNPKPRNKGPCAGGEVLSRIAMETCTAVDEPDSENT